MAHLVVYRETIIGQENQSGNGEDKTLSIGKHSRGPAEAKQFGAIGTENKRRALGSISNTHTQSSGYGNNLGELLTHKTTLQANVQVGYTLL